MKQKALIQRHSEEKIRTVVSHCLHCGFRYIHASNFVIPEIGNRHCLHCRHADMRYYEAQKTKESINNLLKGGLYRMATEKKEKTKKPVKEKSATSEPKAKKQIRGYDDSIKEKAIQMARQGKSVTEIVKTLNGPKAKAVVRYLEKAGVKDIKKK